MHILFVCRAFEMAATARELRKATVKPEVWGGLCDDLAANVHHNPHPRERISPCPNGIYPPSTDVDGFIPIPGAQAHAPY